VAAKKQAKEDTDADRKTPEPAGAANDGGGYKLKSWLKMLSGGLGR
jgi:hypothetical protein